MHESSGDWVIYFTNYTELCTFREVLETLWADSSLVSFKIEGNGFVGMKFLIGDRVSFLVSGGDQWRTQRGAQGALAAPKEGAL